MSCDDGIINQDFCGEMIVLMTYHSSVYHTVKIGDRIVQTFCIKKLMSNLKKVDDLTLLSETARGRGGFGSTGTN